jgi:hypothetical protein
MGGRGAGALREEAEAGERFQGDGHAMERSTMWSAMTHDHAMTML